MLLHLIGFQFIILAWIDLWGPTVGWTIRFVLAIVGGLMWALSTEEPVRA